MSWLLLPTTWCLCGTPTSCWRDVCQQLTTMASWRSATLSSSYHWRRRTTMTILTEHWRQKLTAYYQDDIMNYVMLTIWLDIIKKNRKCCWPGEFASIVAFSTGLSFITQPLPLPIGKYRKEHNKDWKRSYHWHQTVKNIQTLLGAEEAWTHYSSRCLDCSGNIDKETNSGTRCFLDIQKTNKNKPMSRRSFRQLKTMSISIVL